MKKITLMFCFALLLIPFYTKAEVIFEDNFDNQADWWPVQARPGGNCNPSTGKDVYGKLLFFGGKCMPSGWSGARNDEMWNPYDISGGTAAVPGSHPVIEISDKNHYGPTGKAFMVWNESNKGWGGDGWGADGILTKYLGRDYKELYVQFKIKYQPGFKWKWAVNGNSGSIKTFRIEHWDEVGSWYKNFKSGTNAPNVIYNYGVSQLTGQAPKFGGSNSFRCDPQDDYYVVFNEPSGNYPAGSLYRTVRNSLASNDNSPANALCVNPSGGCASNTYWAFVAAPYDFTKASYSYGNYVMDGQNIYSNIKGYTPSASTGNPSVDTVHWKLTQAGGTDGPFEIWTPGKQYYSSDYYCDRDHPGYSLNAAGSVTFKDDGSNNSLVFEETVGDGEWHTMQFYTKMSDGVGIANGSEKIWYDGHLVYDRSDLQFISPGGTTQPIGWNIVHFGGNAFNNFAGITNTTYQEGAEQWYAIDDAVISTERIPDNYVIGGGSTFIPLKYNLTHFTNLFSNWLKAISGQVSDVNNDGVVNAKDLGIMMNKWE